MKTVWTVVGIGIILAARGMYDAEVGSSGGRCGPVVMLEGIKEGAGSVRCKSSFDWFAMRRRNKYKVKSILKPKFARVRSTINIERKPRERNVVVNQNQGVNKKREGRNEEQRTSPNVSASVSFFLLLANLPNGCREVQMAFFVYRVAVTNGCPRGITWMCTAKPVSCGSGWGVTTRGAHSRGVKASRCW